jgi:acyl dehydratase
MRWHCDALATLLADTGEVVLAGPSIHTDDDVARSSGLPSRVADGMISTNWLSSTLTACFGEVFLSTGSLRTRYVRPIFEDERIEAVVRITTVDPLAGDESLLRADVWCANERGDKCTVGEASVRLAR